MGTSRRVIRAVNGIKIVCLIKGEEGNTSLLFLNKVARLNPNHDI
jgi:hypothetical protein